MTIHFPWVQQQLVTVPSTNFHFRASSRGRCGSAVEYLSTQTLENVKSLCFRSPCRLTSCLFIERICCDPASNMFVLPFLSNCIPFRSVFCLRSFTFLSRFFKSKNFYTKRSSLAKQQQSWKPFLNGPRKDHFVSFLTIFSVQFDSSRNEETLWASHRDHYLPFKPIWILQSAPNQMLRDVQAKKRHHVAPSKKMYKSMWIEVP